MARQACRDAPPDDEEAFILSGDAGIPASDGVEDDTMVSIGQDQYLVEAEVHHGASLSEVLDTADIPVELTFTACVGEQKLEEFKPSDKPQPLLSAWQPSDMPFEEMDEMPTKALSSHAIISPIPPSAGPGKRQRRHTMVFNREEMPFNRQVSQASKTELMRQNLAKKRLGHMDVETSTARVCQDIRLQRSQSDTSILQTNDNMNNYNDTSGGPETGNTNMTARDDASAISAHDNVVQQGSMVDGAINQDSMATVFESAYAVLHLEDDDGSPGDDLKKPSLTSTQQLTDAQLLQLEMEATGEMKKKLPHYVLYIIIVLLLCSVFISLFFTEIYMIELTTESSYCWACLVVFALLEEVFIFEPLKVASVVIYRAVFPAANNR
ncbi:uncharacterized protein LOC106175318 [Lingula anatina]|uniref:Uncharacterized protein LOC106175318 n=1 Tax=Lingula anatina TaxID=7574 RepID=A0A1S3JQP7_LINAN|nr:uncharacterized protein LOC106175318 [Lingula anatina]|eukprot:XP_013412713.1 uncharacterized protein LOC106175318 [Lingula anatina]